MKSRLFPTVAGLALINFFSIPLFADSLIGQSSTPAPAVKPAADDDNLLTPAKPAATKPAASDDDLLSDDLLTPAKKPAAGDDDLLGGDLPAAPKPKAKPAEVLLPPRPKAGELIDPHMQMMAKEKFPSASECAACHKQIYDEWRSSNHAYASVSPVFHKFEQKINDLASGTIGYFCMRCHAGVSTSLGETRDLALWKRTEVSREGVTCITCHRVDEQYSKVNGERRISTGDLTKPMFGPFDGDGVAKALAEKSTFRVKGSTTESGPGQLIHSAGVQFNQIGTSEFCVSCHQVQVHPGIKLEVVWDQYRGSPSLKNGTTCQECHMGKTPGRAEGYLKGPAAIVGGRVVNPDRQHSNHAFYGPGYPIVHPGIFPHNPAAKKFPMQTWLKFDFRAGWGNDDFEAKVTKDPSAYKFPPEWESPEDRYDARGIVDENLIMLEQKRQLREAVMSNGSKLDGPFFKADPVAGKPLKMYYTLHNVNAGHNLPSGSLGAQPEIWLNVALFDPTGKNVWESGYVDSRGDMADLQSVDVRSGKLKADRQLFNLQTKFLTTNVKGTDREMYLPINIDIDQLPFIRPSSVPTSVLNHPPFIRMESRSIPPLSKRDAEYTIPASALAVPGKYRLSVRLRSRAEPMYFMHFIEATPEMNQEMNAWMIDIHPMSAEFTVQPNSK